MKRVLILGADDDEFLGFEKMLESDGKLGIYTCGFSDLNYDLDGDNTKIFIKKTGEDVKNFDKIVVMVMAKQMINCSTYSALSCYCCKNGISLTDEPTISDIFGKLYQMWKLWEQDVSVPKTAFGDADFLAQKLADYGGKAILKPILGSMGNNNYFVQSEEQLRKIVGENVNKDCHNVFILQEYIENIQDVRIYSLDYKAKLSVIRTATTWENGESAVFGRNIAAIFNPETNRTPEAMTQNLSESEVLEMLPSQDEFKKFSDVGVKASKALGVGLSGVDLVWDEKANRPVVLEVNRTPHITYKIFAEQKMKVVRDWLVEG